MPTSSRALGWKCLCIAVMANCTLVLLPSDSLALSPDKPVSAYVLETWTGQDGLPHNTIEAITQTPEGFLWFGTAEGLVRYDGRLFSVFGRENFNGLKSDHIKALSSDPDSGALWVGTYGGGLIRYSYLLQDYTLFSKDHGLTDLYITALALDRSNRLFVGTAGGGLLQMRNEQFGPVTTADGTSLKSIASLHTGPDGTLFVIADHGGLYTMPEDEEYIRRTPQIANMNIVSLSTDHEGRLWLGTANQGLVQYDMDLEKVVSFPESSLGTSRLDCLFEDSDNNLWVNKGTGGVVRIRSLDVGSITADDYLRAPHVNTFLEDHEGNLWIGTGQRGLIQLKKGKFRVYTTRHGLRSNTTNTVLERHNGDVLIGTVGGGLHRLENETVVPLSGFPNLADDVHILSLTESADQTLWIAVRNIGIVRLKKNGDRLFTTADGLPTTSISVVFIDTLDNLWAGSSGDGLYRLDGEQFVAHGSDVKLSSSAITGMAEDSTGQIWVATEHSGVAVLSTKTIRMLDEDDGLCSDMTSSIRTGPDGSIWIAGSNGICRYQDGSFTGLNKDHGLPVFSILDLLFDGEGNLWMTSNKGILQASRDDLDTFLTHQSSTVSFRRFSVSDGMIETQCSGGTQPNLVQLSDGHILVPTSAGLVSVSPDHLPVSAQVPPVFIHAVRVDGTPINPRIAQTPPLLPSDLKLIEFDYAALSFVAPKQIVFRTRLEGLDDDWVYSGNETTASFRHLPPGKYVFQVQAANADGVWNPDGASYELAVELPIHETWYFKIGLVLTIVLVTMGLTVLWSRLRYIRLKNREAQLEKMVSQRTQDLREATLNDALTGLRNRRYISEVIIPELKAFANRRQYVHSNDSPRRSVEEQGVYGLFLIDIDHFKEVNDTYGHDAGDLLLSSFATVLRSLVRSDDIVVRWGGEEFLVILKNIDPTFLNTFAAKLLRRISSKSFEIGRTRKLKLSRTCSLGCANFPFIADQPTCFSFDQVLMLADLGLYESKNSGRNQGVRILTTGKAPDQEQIASLLSSLDYGRQHQFVTSNVVPGESVPE